MERIIKLRLDFLHERNEPFFLRMRSGTATTQPTATLGVVATTN